MRVRGGRERPLGITSIVANFTACMQDLSFANVGIVAGTLGMASNVFSALANPLIGRYIDRTGNYTLIFVLMAVLPAVRLGAILVFDHLVHGRVPRRPVPNDGCRPHLETSES